LAGIAASIALVVGVSGGGASNVSGGDARSVFNDDIQALYYDDPVSELLLEDDAK
jgi:ATP-dependent phosphoenolpyruvate carboxykinase